jgi:glycosyltransferase involved in cell wall biosynthesis
MCSAGYRIGIDARLTYYRQGGIAQYTQHLIRELACIDHANRYLVLHNFRDRRNLAQPPNQHRVACLTPAHHRFERLTMAVETFRLGLDLLHSPDFIPPLDGRYRSVITVHDLTFLHYPDFLTAESRRYYNGQIRAAVARADHILADSQATRDDIVNLLGVPPAKITPILLAADERFRPVPAADVDALLGRYGLPHGYVLFLGIFEPRKNLAGLLRAYARLRNSLPDASSLVLAGQRGWLYEQIFDLAADLKLSDHIRWLEDVPPGDLPALYCGAGVLCLPSFYEGFGLPALEAMACGTPVVVSERASLPEVVGEAGLTVDPDSPEAIADALGRVLSDSTLATDLRERGLARAAAFSWRETARQTLDVYVKVLAG